MAIMFDIMVFISLIGAANSAERLRGTAAAPDPTRTMSSQHQDSFNIQPRDTPTPTLRFNNMPTCLLSECVTPSGWSSLPCSSIATPCPSGTSGECSTFDLDCWCNLATPYQCAFHPCSWPDVFLIENWFNETCPNTNPTVQYDFTVNAVRHYVPACAQDCIHIQTISYGCTSESINCFCSHESLYGCTSECSVSENSTIADWLATTCQLSNEDATEAVADDTTGASSFKDGGPKPPSPAPPLKWYEIMPIVVLSVTTGSLLILVTAREWFDKTKHRKKD